MPKSKSPSVGRRGFLRGAAATAALVVKPGQSSSRPHRLRERRRRFRRRRSSLRKPARRPRASMSTPPTGPGRTSWSTSSSRSASSTSRRIPGRASAGCTNRSSTTAATRSPELLTCCHEESSVAMAHGYAKIEGKPMMVMAHGTVGLQHASMAIYNAYADRVPVYIVLGNIARRARARPQRCRLVCTACRTPRRWSATS